MKDLWALAVLFILAAGSLPSSHTGVEVEETKAPFVIHGEDIAEECLSHSVTILYIGKDGKTGGMGSGILYNRNDKWYVMTAAHVIADEAEESYGCGKILVMFTPSDSDIPTHSWTGTIAACNSKIDAAVIELGSDGERGMSAAKFMKAPPRIGKNAYAVGNPAGDINTVTEGIVCHNHRSVDWCSIKHYQITCNGAPGSSGGGVYSADTGECFGIVVRLNHDSRILMVLPTNQVIEWMHSNNLSEIAPY